MRGIHHMLIHLPLTLWLLAMLMILVRSFSGGKLARASEDAFVPVVVLSLLGGAGAIISGFMVWTWEGTLYSPLTRNHILLSFWGMGLWAVMGALAWQGGTALWEGFGRWIMIVLGLAASLVLVLTGTSGGKIAGIPSFFFGFLQDMGLNIYQTYYVPTYGIVIMVVVGIVMAFIGGLAGRRQQ